METPNEPKLTDHDYDGIREYDNPLPNWWLLSFFGTIIFAALYWLHYEIAGGPSLHQELQAAMQAIESQKGAVAVKELSEEDLEARMKGMSLDKAAANFAGKCASCHGQQLQGLIGPNLTDPFWLHGHGKRADILHSIRKGIPEKGMPPWEAILSEDEAISLAAYILSKQDSNPAGAKEPQGEKVR